MLPLLPLIVAVPELTDLRNVPALSSRPLMLTPPIVTAFRTWNNAAAQLVMIAPLSRLNEVPVNRIVPRFSRVRLLSTTEFALLRLRQALVSRIVRPLPLMIPAIQKKFP